MLGEGFHVFGGSQALKRYEAMYICRYTYICVSTGTLKMYLSTVYKHQKITEEVVEIKYTTM